MDEPLMILSAAIDAMYAPCVTCAGVGELPTYERRTAVVAGPDALPPALAEIAARRVQRPPSTTMVQTITITCSACLGRGKNPTDEGRAVAERLARMLVPFLDNALEPAPHEHEHSHQVY